MREDIAAGIVLFNPELGRLKKSLDILCKQVHRVFLVDNGSENIVQIKEILMPFSNCELLTNSENKGIATALNQLMELAEQRGYRWMLTLDDDSVCDEVLVERLGQYVSEEKIGIVCPVAIDDKMEKKGLFKETGMTEVDSCITAGALTNIAAWRRVGGFDDRMFIDFVDIEFCTRLRLANYRILQVPGVYVHQQ